MNSRYPARPPRVSLAILEALVRGDGADFVIGDVVERFAEDLDAGVSPSRARLRFRWNVAASCLAWWSPSALRQRRAEGRERPMLTSRSNGDGLGAWLSGLLRDLGVAARGLRRRPGFALGVACTLGLGIGATTTMFTVIDGVLLKPLPYQDPSRLVAVGAVFPTREWDPEVPDQQYLAGISLLNYRDYSEQTRALETVGAVERISVLFPDEGAGPELVPAARVTADLLPLLGVGPALGRLFTASDYSEEAPEVVLLSFGAWVRRFGASPDVMGQAMETTGTGGVIVGVLPEDFSPPEAFFTSEPEVWIPLRESHPRYSSRGMRSLAVIGRLGPDATADQARAEARAIADRIATDFPDGNVYPDGSHFGIGVNLLHQQTIGGAGRTLRIFLGASALLLLLACVNAAMLFFSRALDRVQEIDVRRALGAGRPDVVRLLFYEAGLLAVLSGVVGVVIASAGVEAFLGFAPSGLPRLSTVRVDARALAAATVISLGVGLVAGLLPALRWGDPSRAVSASRNSTPRSAHQLRSAMVGVQVALAMVLLSGAGLLVRSFHGIVHESPGFAPEGLVSMDITLKGGREGSAESWQDWDMALSEVRGVPGAATAAGASDPPFRSPSWAPRLLLPGDPPDFWREGVAGFAITPEYFEVLGAPVVAGRDFNRLDGPTSDRVAVVNEAFVRSELHGADPLGLTVRQVEGDLANELRIVGVVTNIVQTSVDEGPRPAIYVPYTQVEWPQLHAIVRTSASEPSIIPELRQAVARFNPIVPPRNLQSMEARISASRTQPRFQAMLIGAFAVVSMLISALGLHAALSHAIRRRRREVGVRIALGATRGRVAGAVVRQGLQVTLAGIAAGLFGSWWTTRLLRDFLYGVTPHDPATMVAVAALLFLVALLATGVPAQRATLVDPLEALRSE